jgi:cysteinyl-tRNA synthetase
VGLIFDTVKFKDYAKFAKLSIDELKKGARVEPDPERRNSSDFALWITNQPTSVMQWASPWGKGFPGWHIECSAMSSKYFGEQFDIHTGGEEHIPIHHTNEIAQSEAAFGKKPWVKYWLHMRWLLFKGEKMSKSTGGIYRLSQLEEEGYKPLALRYLFLTAQYRTQLDFTMEALQNAQNSYLRLKNIAETLEDDGKTNKKYLAQFEKAVNDDLNTPEALAVLWNFIRDPKAIGKLNTLAKMDEVLGLDLLKKEKSEISEHVKIFIEQREEARKKKDFKTADRIRNELKEKGIILEDQPDGGTRWKVIK